MEKQDFQDAFIELFFSINKPKQKNKTIKWHDDYGLDSFITFPTSNPNEVIVERYWKNGNKHSKEQYKNGLLCGESLWWYIGGNILGKFNYKNNILWGKVIKWHENKNKWYEGNYLKGLRYGKETDYYEDGHKGYERWWKNGKLHGKCIVWQKSLWCRNDYLPEETEYENGKLIRKIL